MFAIAFMDSICYRIVMKLTEYLKSGRKTASELAREVGVAPSMIYQYRTGLRSVPAWRCPEIEKATGGLVTRKDLRPNDWQEIWPELAEQTYHQEAFTP